MSVILTFLDFAILALAAFLLKAFMNRKSTPLPPGPRRLPLIGNLLDMPSSQEWLTFAEWGKKWGDIVSVSVLGQNMILINSVTDAIEMLDKRSSIYSDRPIVQMGGELCGWKNTLGLMAYGDRFRTFRKLFHQVIGTQSAVSRFLPLEEQETHRFLKRILANPDDLTSHVRKTAGAIILRISHGYGVEENEDPFVTMAEIATEQFSLSTAPGVFLVNVIPALRHIPQWFPGAGFKKLAAEWAHTLQVMADGPHQFVKNNIANGTAEDSFTSRLLESNGVTPSHEHDIKWSAASLYSGGADTTVSAIYAVFLAAVLYPEAVKKVQEELDSVVGPDRLPTFLDRENLPYTNAFALEVLRWHSVTPTGVPHRIIHDDIYNGYLIPEGSVVISNVWAMAHDTRFYTEPFSFKPERFLGPTPELNPKEFCFGFGRRICPGRLLADLSLFISCAMSLAVFDITKYSKDGTLDEPVQEQTTGIISHLKPFRCSIKPRTHRAESLINADVLEIC